MGSESELVPESVPEDSQKRKINRKMFYSLALFVANGIGRVTNIHVVIVMKRSNILKLVDCILIKYI